MSNIRLLLADDHPLFLEGLLSLLEKEKDMAIVQTASDGDSLLKILEEKKADVCVLDINMPGMSGLDAAKIIRTRWPEMKVIMLTTYNDREFISEMILAGVSGYVLKNSTRAELVQAIREVAGGRNWFSKEVQQSIMDDYTQRIKREKGKENTPAVLLTQRETEIVRLLAKEYTNEKIAQELHISFRTVETHRKNIMQKTKAQNLAGLIRFAYAQGLIT